MLNLVNIQYSGKKSSFLSQIFDAEDESGKRYIIKQNNFRFDENNMNFLEWLMQNPHKNLLTPLEIREENSGKITETYEFVEWPLFSDLTYKMFPLEKNREASEFDKALKIIEQLTSALGHIHSQGYIHHDVRAENILLNPESLEVKLFDYNLTKKIYFLDRKIDSWHDDPPEARTGNTWVDFKLDVYRTGSIFFNMTHTSTFNLGKFERNLRLGVPTEALRIIKKAYSDDTKERYQDCNEMLKAITNLRKSLTNTNQ